MLLRRSSPLLLLTLLLLLLLLTLLLLLKQGLPLSGCDEPGHMLTLDPVKRMNLNYIVGFFTSAIGRVLILLILACLSSSETLLLACSNRCQAICST